ncbi:MAG: hypothetical protein HOC18_06640 [Candidatus Marinimicrobia bacterium]|jgi:hypothetical protein|nr:hypothetical protein [Candidatus Neomarinimicrobiota bacterium]
MDWRVERTIRYKGQQVNNMEEDYDGEYRSRSFEDHFRPDARSDYSDLIQKERIIPKEEKKEKKKGKNIVELITGGEDIGEFARKLNLDPEMAEKMLVPLLSLLDKYGVGETLTDSPKVESATNAFEVIRDVAPVIKGAAEFISGRRAELESTDLAFLEQIKEAQGVADASLFDDEDELFTIGESVIEEPVEIPSEPQPAPLDLNSFNSKDWGNFFATEGSMQPPQKEYDIVNNDLTHALDAQQNAVEQWAKQEGVAVRQQVNKSKGLGNLDMNVRTDYQNMELGGGDAGIAHTFTEVAGMNENAFAIVDVTDLAASQGLSMNEIMEGDSQRKINREAQEEWVTEPIDVLEFIPEDTPIDYEELEVPEAAEEYDPLHIQDFDLPSFDLYDIEEVEILQKQENESRNDTED